MSSNRLDISTDRLAEFCRRWRISELSVFGSVLRDDFRADSDVDVLIAFDDDADWDYLDWPRMEEELRPILGGHSVDLVERRSVVNPFMRHRILTTRRVLYAA
jgi:predicted nucleotidyltransferase